MIWILWYGKEGKSTYNWLIKNGVKPENIKILDKSLDENYLQNLDQFDKIYKSPGISIYLPEIQAVREKITSQAEVFFDKFKWKIILVSGSKGKSTTSTLMYLFLKQAGKKVSLVGNIWNPIFDEIDFENQPDYVVFEISSYMLDSTPNVWCDYSILTNLYKVHTNWHKTHKNYQNAKFKLLNANKLASLNVELKSLVDEKPNFVWFGPGTDYYFDEKFVYGKKYKIPLEKIKIWWAHNYQNIASCFPILEAENIPQADIEEVLKNFNGLEHRQEFVTEINGIKFYNDSIATIPESVLQALNRFQHQLDTVILGGQDNNFDYSQVIEKINLLPLKNVILLPNSFDAWKDKFKNKNIFEVKNMEEAVKIAKQVTQKWKVCILSPGAPSYNLFKNFEERGKQFKQAVGYQDDI